MDVDNNLEDGFSSDSDIVQEQEVIQNRPPTTQKEQQEKDQVKWKLPSPQKIRQKVYSLNPDIQTGWTCRIQKPKPIPILHQNPYLDPLLAKVLKQGKNKAKLVYFGARQPTTYEAWYRKQFPFPYSHIVAPAHLKYTNRQFHGTNEDSSSCLLFDSKIESGNLDAAVRVRPYLMKIGEKQYELFLRVDSNTKGHIQWFNFTVRNMKKDERYTFYISNFQKQNSLFNRGSKPYIFSKRKNQFQKVGWEQAGENVKYERKVPKSANILNYEMSSMFRLTFHYQPEYENDTIQIAYSIPYTYTKIQQFLQRLIQGQKRSYLKISTLCTSLGGLQVPLLTINQGSSDKKSQKKCIIISGRAHPGESNGSYMMEGFITFLCGNSVAARNLRKQVMFKVIPMLNPDGVALGNYRTGLSGKDFNREFRLPDSKIFPEVYSLKKLIAQNKEQYKDDLLMFLDFHGHSVKKNVFMYGPEFSITNKNYYECRVFPKILGQTTSMFRYYSCMFKISQFKVSTARAVVLRKLNIPLSYTIEASNGSFYNHGKLKDIPFNENLWCQMGQKIGQSLNEYVIVCKESESNKKKRMEKKQKPRKLSVSYVANSKNFENYQKKKKTIANIYNDEEKKQPQTPIQKAYFDIDKLEKEKIDQENSEDGLSEGSSDQEDEDNLGDERLQIFYKLLKKKTGGFTYNEKEINKFLESYEPGEYCGKKTTYNKDILNYNPNKTYHGYLTEKQTSNSSNRIHGKKKTTLFNMQRRSKQSCEEMIDFRFRLTAPRKISFGTTMMGKDEIKPPTTQRLRSNSFHPSHSDFHDSFIIKKEGYLYQGLKKQNQKKQQKSTNLQKHENWQIDKRVRSKGFEPF